MNARRRTAGCAAPATGRPEVGLIPIVGPWVPAGQTSCTGVTAHTTVSVWVDTRG
ncbi:hypothetical protein ACIA8R_37330 [Nonomuraea sp. NPDC051191]|uniref:hypothetical protein n=1 Tax=Nonomuraea sp. NPDC051191 TaxID=3364372 RepID=UPI00378FA4F5